MENKESHPTNGLSPQKSEANSTNQVSHQNENWNNKAFNSTMQSSNSNPQLVSEAGPNRSNKNLKKSGTLSHIDNMRVLRDKKSKLNPTLHFAPVKTIDKIYRFKLKKIAMLTQHYLNYLLK